MPEQAKQIIFMWIWLDVIQQFLHDMLCPHCGGDGRSLRHDPRTHTG